MYCIVFSVYSGSQLLESISSVLSEVRIVLVNAFLFWIYQKMEDSFHETVPKNFAYPRDLILRVSSSFPQIKDIQTPASYLDCIEQEIVLFFHCLGFPQIKNYLICHRHLWPFRNIDLSYSVFRMTSIKPILAMRKCFLLLFNDTSSETCWTWSSENNIKSWENRQEHIYVHFYQENLFHICLSGSPLILPYHSTLLSTFLLSSFSCAISLFFLNFSEIYLPNMFETRRFTRGATASHPD